MRFNTVYFMMKTHMPHFVRCILVAAAAFFSLSANSCEVNFKVAGDATSYPYSKLPQFVTERIRQLVTATQDEMDRYDLEISADCPNQAPPSVATFSIQKNTVYLKDLNGVPLCTEERKPEGLRCIRGKYNFVDYRGGSQTLVASKTTVAQAVEVLSAVKSVNDLEEADKTPTTKQKVHDAVRLFALILAESARFDYVLDDLRCTVNTNAGVKFQDYWTLVHNWGTITAFVQRKRPDLRPPYAVSGVGSLFVPVTRDAVSEFNKHLAANPPPPTNTTPDGKNKPVPLRQPTCPLDRSVPAPAYDAQVERDHIFALASMVMVKKDWQVNTNGRGHNIGSILVDSTSKPVFWARNAIRQRDDATQHGEVRLIQNFLSCPSVGRNGKGYTVYTTLEPCAMCAGMLAMTEVSRVVYIQTDEGFGRTLSALRAINYPRVYVEATPVSLKEKQALEAAFTKRKTETGSSSVTDFLLSPDALKIFVDAGNALDEFEPKYPENAVVLANTKGFLNSVTTEKYDTEMLAMCPKP